jgi:hypothetical protein
LLPSSLPEIAAAAKDHGRNWRTGIDSWVVNSGSGYNLVSRRAVDKGENIIKVETPLRLATANGIITVNEKIIVSIQELGIRVEAWVLEDTPLVLSLENLIKEHGCDFGWSNLDVKRAWLKKGTKTIELPICQGVPNVKL